MNIVRTDTGNNDFMTLIGKLDTELTERYGALQMQYEAHNKIGLVHTGMVGYVGDLPVACGCFKCVNSKTIEIKRMYVSNAYRRRGFSVFVLSALEKWGSELGYSKAVLETGKRQPEAIGLYRKCGYKIIENYGPYKDFENSICMGKSI